MDKKTTGALKRIIEEVKVKRNFRCLYIDCPCNNIIGGDDIAIAVKYLANQYPKDRN